MPSSEPMALELGPAGGPVLRVQWDVEALRELRTAGKRRGADEAPPTWRVDAEPDWQATSALRVISASFEDGALLAVAALRPREAEGHDADAVGAILISPEGEVVRLHEVLLSTEYGRDGRARRLGLELYERSDGPPIRVAADRDGTVEGEARGGAGEETPLRLKMEGTPGTGLHELIPARQPSGA
jgi:hypothetical protein